MQAKSRMDEVGSAVGGGVPTKYLIHCESCGHQAVIGVVVRHGKMPDFYCSWCGDVEPVVERADPKRNFQSMGR